MVIDDGDDGDGIDFNNEINLLGQIKYQFIINQRVIGVAIMSHLT